MAEPELEDHHWRAFRLFLVPFDDRQFEKVRKELAKEMAARRDCDNGEVRLFFSSMTAGDLEEARQQMNKERRARAHDRRVCALARRQKRKPAVSSNEKLEPVVSEQTTKTGPRVKSPRRAKPCRRWMRRRKVSDRRI